MMKETRNTPATRWLEAFPLGNGHIGAMVYGGYGQDQIDLTHNTFFSGEYSREANQPGAADAFYRTREEIQRGDYKKAHESAEKFIGKRMNYGTNLPVGALHIMIDGKKAQSEVQNYKRSLDISKGVVMQEYDLGTNHICTKTFVSHADKVLVYELSSESPVDAEVSIKLYCDGGKVRASEDRLLFETQAVETMHCDEEKGVFLAGCVAVQSNAGKVWGNENTLTLCNLVHATFFVAMATNFDRETISLEVLEEENGCCILGASQKDPETLLKYHMEDISSKMKRLGLKLVTECKEEAEQIEFLFQFGRYLLLCASREDSVLPAHLQGIWNDNVACRIGWTCDMHLDINTQMNYWPAEAGNLPETMEPLTNFVCDHLAVHGAVSAENNYNLPGWTAEIVTNAWGFTAPYWAVPIAPYPSGGMWILTQLWEHYETTVDFAYLGRIFTTIEQAAAFCVAYIFPDKDGCYSCGPSISAENSFVIDGETYYLSNGCTGEILMIREVLTDYLAACQVMEEHGQQTDSKIKEAAQNSLPKLLPYRILKDGTIAEWNHDYPAADPQHRHTSHLLGLFPFAQITLDKTPELAEAAERTIQRKMTPPENWEDTGWSRSMLMLYEARLQSGDEAYEHMQAMLKNLLAPNGMIIHPPTRGAGSFDNVYEMDGNTGLTTAVTELLLQSYDQVIHLLPALPTSWKDGMVRGLGARGGVTVDIVWADNCIVQAYACADHEKIQQFRYGYRFINVHLKSGIRTKLSFEPDQNTCSCSFCREHAGKDA